MDKSRTIGETEQDYLRSQCESAECAVSRQGIWRDHRHGKSEPQAPAHEPSRRVRHQSEKTWWGCGAASALTEAVLAFAKENGFEQLNLEVRSDNARAIRLYEKYGFRKLCTFPDFFKIDGESIDFDLMNLELT